MFNLPENTTTVTWSSTEHGRGHRLQEVLLGGFLIDHIATGRSIVGFSKNVSKDVDIHIQKIKTGKHEIKFLNSLCKDDSDLKIYEFPTNTLKAAKEIESTIISTMHPKYLLIN